MVGGVVAGRWNLDLAAEGYETKKVTVDLDKVLAADPGNNQVRAIAAQAALEGKMVDRARQLLATEAKADFRRVIELSPRGEMADMSRKALDSLK